MGQLSRSAASLGFYGDDLDPDEITARLGATPTFGVGKGGTWVTSRGVEKVAVTGSWRLEADDRQPGDLDGQITALFAPLTTDLATWRELAARHRGRIFCGLFLDSFNEGLSLGPEATASLGDRGLVLGLDIYAPVEPD